MIDFKILLRDSIDCNDNTEKFMQDLQSTMAEVNDFGVTQRVCFGSVSLRGKFDVIEVYPTGQMMRILVKYPVFEKISQYLISLESTAVDHSNLTEDELSSILLAGHLSPVGDRSGLKVSYEDSKIKVEASSKEDESIALYSMCLMASQLDNNPHVIRDGSLFKSLLHPRSDQKIPAEDVLDLISSSRQALEFHPDSHDFSLFPFIMDKLNLDYDVNEEEGIVTIDKPDNVPDFLFKLRSFGLLTRVLEDTIAIGLPKMPVNIKEAEEGPVLVIVDDGIKGLPAINL